MILKYTSIVLMREKRDYILFPVKIQKKLGVDRVING